MNSTKLKITLNIGENTSHKFGAVTYLIRHNDKPLIQSALCKTFEHLKESKGIYCDYGSIDIKYIDRKTKYENPDLENAFCVEFAATSSHDKFDCEFSIYSAIGMMATALFQECIAFSISADFGVRWIETCNGLAGLYQHDWGNAFDSSQFVTAEQAKRGEF